MALFRERYGQAGPDPPTPDDDDVHGHSTTRAPRQCKGANPTAVPPPPTLAAVSNPSAPERVAPAALPRSGARERPAAPLPGIAGGTIPERRRYRLKNKLLGPPLVLSLIHI